MPIPSDPYRAPLARVAHVRCAYGGTGVSSAGYCAVKNFAEFVQYLGGLQQRGTIQAFEIVFLDPHGGDLNGFFLMRGEPSKLDALVGSHDWITHTVRAMLHLQGFGAVRGVTGASTR